MSDHLFEYLSNHMFIWTIGLTNIFIYTFNDILDCMSYIVSECVRLNVWIFSHCVLEYMFNYVSHLCLTKSLTVNLTIYWYLYLTRCLDICLTELWKYWCRAIISYFIYLQLSLSFSLSFSHSISLFLSFCPWKYITLRYFCILFFRILLDHVFTMFGLCLDYE